MHHLFSLSPFDTQDYYAQIAKGNTVRSIEYKPSPPVVFEVADTKKHQADIASAKAKYESEKKSYEEARARAAAAAQAQQEVC